MAVHRSGRESGETASNSDIVVRDAVKEYLIDCRVRNLSSRTIEWYEEKLEALLGDLKDLPLSCVSISEVRSLTEALMQGRSVATVNGYLRTRRAFLNWSVREGLQVGFDPRRVRCLKEPKRIPPCFTKEQVQAPPKQPDQSKLRDDLLRRVALLAHPSRPFHWPQGAPILTQHLDR